MKSKIDYISPKQLLKMTVVDFLNSYGNPDVSKHLKTVVFRFLNENPDQLRDFIESGKKSRKGKPLLVSELVQLPVGYLRMIGIGPTSFSYILDALAVNNLTMNMSEQDINKYIEKFDKNLAMLKSVLRMLCKQCENEQRNDISKVFVGKSKIVSGYECYVLVTKI